MSCGFFGSLDGLEPEVSPVEGDLPMTVWVRGDEPYAAEFALDADQVMLQLGIRRSRLTQISGRELRVGRARKGRYVTPVFRQVDVDAYRAWTRPTASHVKSSAVLHDAAAALKDESLRVAASLDTAVRETRLAVEHSVRAGVAATSERLEGPLAALRAEVAAFQAETLHAQAVQEKLTRAAAERSERLEAALALESERSARLETELAQLRGAVVALGDAAKQHMAALRLAFTQIEQAREDSRDANDTLAHVLGELRDAQAALAAAMLARPKRKPSHGAARRLSRKTRPAPPQTVGGKPKTSRKPGTANVRRARKPRP